MFTNSPRTWNDNLYIEKRVIVWNFTLDYTALLKLKRVGVVTFLEIVVSSTGECVLTKLELCFSRNNFSLSVKLMFAGL